jgi:hypothetical protein
MAEVARGHALPCQAIESERLQRGGRNKLSRIGSEPRPTSIHGATRCPSGRANRNPGKINQRSIGGGLGVDDNGVDFGAREQFDPLQG